ncbi:response regulator [Streptococcus gallolyticus]|uniref:response regulator transcription factor n=2 Tax=Streptococcus gallolyticus TaxID=315405 RepID=UPI0022849CCD|nr:response regulator transcription factor [Streptococcus gallolyticus]MCY7166120.1 response regulator transcription factor [Streptococcus gallolyticus subsp. gallolyticus]MCY7183218.1 response regulator transcription factor [Streptococcus gallolyticus subsp. gallolyticus]
MKILLIDDHKLFAKSIQLMCEQFDEIDTLDTLTANFDNFDINPTYYDIVLLDINLTNISKENGLDLAEKLIQNYPGIKVAMLTGYVKSVYEERAKKIGTYGFIDKNIEPDKLLRILKIIYSGKKYFEQFGYQDCSEELTKQEVTILDLSRKGHTIKEIEETLYISRRTVFNHLSHIYAKLSVNNKQEAIYKAEQLGYFMDF